MPAAITIQIVVQITMRPVVCRRDPWAAVVCLAASSTGRPMTVNATRQVGGQRLGLR